MTTSRIAVFDDSTSSSSSSSDDLQHLRSVSERVDHKRNVLTPMQASRSKARSKYQFSEESLTMCQRHKSSSPVRELLAKEALPYLVRRDFSRFPEERRPVSEPEEYESTKDGISRHFNDRELTHDAAKEMESRIRRSMRHVPSQRCRSSDNALNNNDPQCSEPRNTKKSSTQNPAAKHRRLLTSSYREYFSDPSGLLDTKGSRELAKNSNATGH